MLEITKNCSKEALINIKILSLFMFHEDMTSQQFDTYMNNYFC